MSQLINKTSVNISKQSKKRTSFAAETPMRKMEAEAKKFISYTAGKYVENEMVEGLLVCLAKSGNAVAYIILDKDRNVVVHPVSNHLKTIKGAVPAYFSILDWMKWHDVESLVNSVNETLDRLCMTAISPVTVNWKLQFGNKDKGEKVVKKNNNNHNKAKK